MKTRLASSLIVLVAAVAFGCACKKKPGDSCLNGEAACLDEKTELVCQEGKYIQAPCNGATGCKMENATVTCDISGNALGDVCSKDDDGNTACAPDKKNEITCKGGRYAVLPCRGPEGCADKGGTVVCDVSIAQLGDSCANLSGEGYACSVDKKSLLKCKGGKFELDEKCSDGKTCKVNGDQAGCQE